VNIVADYLHRNGVLIERAHRDGRSLNRMERQIIAAGRDAARNKGADKRYINEQEMIGERDWHHVLKPLKVVAKFAFYWNGVDEIPPTADYYIVESNHPELPAGGNVSAATLVQHEIKVPSTPTFEQWVRGGRKCFRGGK